MRELTVDLFNELRAYPVRPVSYIIALATTDKPTAGQIGVQFLQALNHFQRYAYVRQAHAKEQREKEANSLSIPHSSFMSRTPSNRSESSLGGG